MSGTWKNGKLEAGSSKWVFPDGSLYEGQQKGYKKDGRGVLTEKNGLKYEGQFKGDKKTDKKAKETSADGTVYEGGFKNGLKDGKGKTTPKEGKPKYQQWAKGAPKKEIDEATYNKG